jgi:hypothetical protein
MIARAGAGPDPIPHKELTVERLSDAINFCLKPESLARAKELASKIATEQGSQKGAQSFHQNLDPDRLRCLLVPSRVAVWRLKRTQVRLSSFAACTLANANLLDFGDLKLFRAQEYDTDEGPWDPISGFAAANFGAFSEMVGGLAEMPAETYRAVRSAGPKRTQSEASTATNTTTAAISRTAEEATIPGSPGRARTSLGGQRPPIHVSRSQPETGPSISNDMLRLDNAHASKGFGRMVKAVFDSPMDMSVEITKGFHNTPKLWGDDTVRPQPQVKDMKSGFQAIGKEFGYGMYDGVTGLVTQPWNGAKKDGASGFVKGVGKGLGGFVTKQGAALFSIPAYFMKGAYKEVENLFGSNVHSYIVASRTAQGYGEWMRSTDAEKQDVVDRWRWIQKYLKKKEIPEDVLRDILEAQRKTSKETAGTSIETTTSSDTSMN